MSDQVHIYLRYDTSHAWKYERTALKEPALVEKSINFDYGIDTLLVPTVFPAMQWLDSYQTQEEINATV